MCDLKPCPFCGSERVILEKVQNDPDDKDDFVYSTYCRNCLSKSDWYLNEEDAIKAWNRRSVI